MKSFDAAKYWLLDLVHDLPFPLYRLTHPELEIIANRKGHGLSHSDLLDTLHSLFQEGLIVNIRHPNDEVIIEFVPTYSEIDLALKGNNKSQYRLTNKGGGRWEVLSKPNWSLFLVDSFNLRTDEIIVEASSLQIAEQYMKLTPYWYQHDLLSESKKNEVLRPWQATYWKELPEGHRISVQTVERACIRLEQDMPPDDREFLNAVRNWYKNPFE